MVNISLAETPVLDRVVAAYNAGQLVEAEQLCQQIIAGKPDFFDAILLLADIQSKLGKTMRRWPVAIAHLLCDRALPRRSPTVVTFSKR
jgi:hypothetical protein